MHQDQESVGFDGLNRIAFDRMRVWILDVARKLLPLRGVFFSKIQDLRPAEPGQAEKSTFD